jgi:hypothetical protein
MMCLSVAGDVSEIFGQPRSMETGALPGRTIMIAKRKAAMRRKACFVRLFAGAALLPTRRAQ